MSYIPQERLDFIDKTLEKANGDRKLAAQILDIPDKDLLTIIQNTPALRRKWVSADMSKSTPLTTELDTVGRVQDKLMDAINYQIGRENVRLRQGLSGLRLTGEEMDLAVELSNFSGTHFKQSIEIVSSSATRSILKLQTELDRISTRLIEVRTFLLATPPGVIREGLVLEERGLMQSQTDIAKETRMAMTSAYEAAKVCAYVKAKNELNGQGGKKGKPGFAPIVLEAKQVNGRAATPESEPEPVPTPDIGLEEVK